MLFPFRFVLSFDSDSLTLFLEQDNHLYIPNAFSPNGDNVNDVLMIMSSSTVEEIIEFIIFDRWGNVVFYNANFQTNDPSEGWDGKMRGQELDPAVFSFKVNVRYTDGKSEVRYGDVTIVK